MKTPDEIAAAISIATQSAQLHDVGDPPRLMLLASADVLRWVLDNPNTSFGAFVEENS